jgi:hypothetical protein
MPPEDRRDNPFFFEAELDTKQLKDAVNKAEKIYIRFGSAMETVVEGLENQEDAQRKTGEAAKEAAKDSLEGAKDTIQGRNKVLGAFKKTGKGILGIFKREKDAVNDMGISFKGLLGILGGATVIGLIGKLVKDYIEWENQIRTLSVAFGEQNRVVGAASGLVQAYTGYLDLSREELVGIVKQMGELQIVSGNTKEAARTFQSIAKEAIHLGKSMDVSIESVVEMYDSFTRVYGLPHNKLRNISASMKYIQETTSISGQELMSFAQSLDDVTSRMIKVTGEGKARATADLMAMAGVLKDMGVQPEKVSQMFGEAMKIHSTEGARFLSFITEGTEYQAEQLRQMMVRGDVETPLSLLIQRVKKESPEWLAMNEEWLTETTRLTMAELTNIQRSTAPVETLIANARKAYDEGRKHTEAAMKRQNKLSMMWNNFKRVLERIWLAIGKNVTIIVTKLGEYLIPVLQRVAERMAEWSGWAQSPNGARAITDWIEKKAIPFFKNMWNVASKVFDWIVDKVKLLIDWWDSLTGTQKKWLVIGGAIATMFGGTIVNAVVGLISKLGPMGAAFTAIGVAAFAAGKKIIDEYYEPIERMHRQQKKWIQEEMDTFQQYADLKYAQHQLEAVANMKEADAVDTLRRLREEGYLTAEGLIKYDQRFIRNVGDLRMLQNTLNKSLEKNVKLTKLMGEKTEGVAGIIKKLGGASKDSIDKVRRATEQATVVSPLGKKVVAPGLEKTIPKLGGTAGPVAATVVEATTAAAAAPVPIPTAPPPVAKVAAPPPVTSAAPPVIPQVTVKADSPTSERLLGEIRDALVRIANSGKAHPSRALVSQVLG